MENNSSLPINALKAWITPKIEVLDSNIIKSGSVTTVAEGVYAGVPGAYGVDS